MKGRASSAHGNKREASASRRKRAAALLLVGHFVRVKNMAAFFRLPHYEYSLRNKEAAVRLRLRRAASARPTATAPKIAP